MRKLNTSEEGFAKYLSALQLEIYRDDTLARVRDSLMEEAINPAEVKYQSCYPLAFGQEVIDTRVRVLAKVRCVIKKLFPSIGQLSCYPEKETKLHNILGNTHDGDLAYRYGENDVLATKCPADAIYSWDLVFSPELQLKAVKSDEDLDEDIIRVLAIEGRLSIDAWRILLGKDNGITYIAILYTKDIRREVLDMINENEKFALLYEARTVADAQEKLFDTVDQYPAMNMHYWLANYEGLISERACVRLINAGYVDDIKENRPVMKLFPELI